MTRIPFLPSLATSLPVGVSETPPSNGPPKLFIPPLETPYHLVHSPLIYSYPSSLRPPSTHRYILLDTKMRRT